MYNGRAPVHYVLLEGQVIGQCSERLLQLVDGRLVRSVLQVKGGLEATDRDLIVFSRS